MVVAILDTGAVPKALSPNAGRYSAWLVEELCTLGVDPQGTVPEPGHIPSELPAQDRIPWNL